MSKDDQTTRDIETLRGWIDAAQPGGVVFFGGGRRLHGKRHPGLSQPRAASTPRRAPSVTITRPRSW